RTLAASISNLLPYTTLFRSVAVTSAEGSPVTFEEVTATSTTYLGSIARGCTTRSPATLSTPLSVAEEGSKAEVSETCTCTPSTSDRKSTRLNSSHVKISYAV